MKARCTGKNARGTGPCQRSASDGFDTCARCGGRLKPRSRGVAELDPQEVHEAIEASLDEQSDRVLDENDAAEMENAIADEMRADGATQTPCVQPYFAAYCRAHGRNRDEQIVADREQWPGGWGTGYVQWIRARWAEWALARGKRRTSAGDWIEPLTEAEREDFGSWLDDESMRWFDRRADVNRSALSKLPAVSGFDAFARHGAALLEEQDYIIGRRQRRSSPGYYLSRMNGHAVRALVGLLEFLAEPIHQGRALIAWAEAHPEAAERMAEGYFADREADREEDEAARAYAEQCAEETRARRTAIESAHDVRQDGDAGLPLADALSPSARSEANAATGDRVELQQDASASLTPRDQPGETGTSSREFHLAQMDCIEWLRSIADESVDLAVADSAYQSLEKHRAIGTTTRLTKDWFPIFGNERQGDLLAELYRVLKRNTHCYLYCDQETAHFLWALMFRLNARGDDVERTERSAREFPFTWWKHLTWMKSRAALNADGEAEASAGMGYHYRAAQECIVFLEKGKRRLNDLGVCDVLPGPRVRGGYPTEKPVVVSRVLIEQSSAPGDLVIDPFLGSGSTGDASLTTGRRFAGCDVLAKSLEVARPRLLALGGVEVGPPPARVAPAQGSLF